jgi:hypothetical protein
MIDCHDRNVQKIGIADFIFEQRILGRGEYFGTSGERHLIARRRTVSGFASVDPWELPTRSTNTRAGANACSSASAVLPLKDSGIEYDRATKC